MAEKLLGKTLHTSSDKELFKEIEKLKTLTGWSETEGLARRWWLQLELNYNHQPGTILKVIQELFKRRKPIQELFLAYVVSERDDLEANFILLDMAIEHLGPDHCLTYQDFIKLSA